MKFPQAIPSTNWCSFLTPLSFPGDGILLRVTSYRGGSKGTMHKETVQVQSGEVLILRVFTVPLPLDSRSKHGSRDNDFLTKTEPLDLCDGLSVKTVAGNKLYAEIDI